ncbi:MAG: spore germination protein, partial [Clostridia bacterium]|nr:spore germination protein [Clostridia bacterium]
MNYSIKQRISAVKKILPSEDILVFEFDSSDGKKFAVIYADGIVDKNMLGELVIKPLKYAGADATAEEVKRLLASPDVKDGKDLKDAVKNISDGNAVLYTDGEKDFYVIGVKMPPGRAVAEPPTQVTVKG